MGREPESLGEQRKDICTSIDLWVRSRDLQLVETSRFLGVDATWGFEAGARYMGKVKAGNEILPVERRRPPFGVWHFDTSCFSDSNILEEHALLLLERFKDATGRLQQLMSDPEYEVGLNLWHVGPAGFALSSQTVARLASISQWMYFVCWETEEDDEENSCEHESSACDSPEPGSTP